MERKGKASGNSPGDAKKYEERDGVKLELSTVGLEKSVPEVKKDVPVMARFLSDELSDKDRKKMEKEHVKRKKPLPRFLKNLIGITALMVLSILLFLGYGYFKDNFIMPGNEESEAPYSTAEGIVSEKDLKAEGTVIIIDIDKENGKIRFKDPESGEEYVLNVISSTVYENAYGKPMVIDQLRVGDIVDIVVSVHSATLASVKENSSEDRFEFRDIKDYDISVNKKLFTYDGRSYRLLDGTVVLQGDDPSEFKKIKNGDVLTIKGIGTDIYTVKQTGGDGYVRIRGAEPFKGGWIELAGIIKPIEGEMLFTVPEGRYTLSVSYMHFGGTKEVNVERGKETRVDVSDLKGDLLKTGKITFTFEPVDAEPDVMIDGKRVDTDSSLELDYGVHTLDVKAEGYVPIHKYLSVGQPMANLSVILEKADKDSASANSSDKNTGKKPSEEKSNPIPTEALPETFRTSSSSAKTNDGNNENAGEDQGAQDDTETVTTEVNQLYIDGPQGVEVYYDGAYKGVAPCHFRKNGGTHVITLMKNGYETKSYTLNLSPSQENESYSFNELLEEEHDA